MTQSWDILDRAIALDTPHYKVEKLIVQLPNGKAEDFFREVRFDWVSVFALTPDEKVLLLHERRVHCQDTLWLLPSGQLGALPNTNTGGASELLAAAQRELQEETGYIASDYQHIQTSYSNYVRGAATNHLFIAKNAVPHSAQNLDEVEDIAVYLATIPEVIAGLQSGRFAALATQAQIYRALHHLGFIK